MAVDEHGDFNSVYVGKSGITDLYASYPYNDWGDFIDVHFGVTEEEYKADVAGYEARITAHNRGYVEELKRSGKYGEEYRIYFKWKYNPLFDSPPPLLPEGKPPLESYRMIFLDNSYDNVNNLNSSNMTHDKTTNEVKSSGTMGSSIDYMAYKDGCNNASPNTSSGSVTTPNLGTPIKARFTGKGGFVALIEGQVYNLHMTNLASGEVEVAEISDRGIGPGIRYTSMTEFLKDWTNMSYLEPITEVYIALDNLTKVHYEFEEKLNKLRATILKM